MSWAVKWCTRDSFRKESHLFTSKQPAKCQSDINILTQSRGYRDFTWSYDKTLYRILKGKLGSFEAMAQGRISQFHSALRRNNIINFASNGTHCPDDYIKHGTFRMLMLRKQDKYSVNNDVWEIIQMIYYWYHVISYSMIWNNMIHNITWHDIMWYEMMWCNVMQYNVVYCNIQVYSSITTRAHKFTIKCIFVVKLMKMSKCSWLIIIRKHVVAYNILVLQHTWTRHSLQRTSYVLRPSFHYNVQPYTEKESSLY